MMFSKAVLLTVVVLMVLAIGVSALSVAAMAADGEVAGSKFPNGIGGVIAGWRPRASDQQGVAIAGNKLPND